MHFKFKISTKEMCELLDLYTLDEIQIMIQENAFDKRMYKGITPYLIERAKQCGGSDINDNLPRSSDI